MFLRRVRGHVHQPVSIEAIGIVRASIQQEVYPSGPHKPIACFHLAGIETSLVEDNGKEKGQRKMLHVLLFLAFFNSLRLMQVVKNGEAEKGKRKGVGECS